MDTSAGRFQSRDSFTERPLSLGFTNLYIYAGANPVMNIDPSGNLTLTDVVVDIAVAGVLALVGNYSLANYLLVPSGLGVTSREHADLWQLEEQIVTLSRSMRGGARDFATLIQHAATRMTPDEIYCSRGFVFLGVLSDVLTAVDHQQGLQGIFGDAGPRSHDRPGWLTTHKDQESDWRRFCNDDVEEPTREEVTGRRDHFIANAYLTPEG